MNAQTPKKLFAPTPQQAEILTFLADPGNGSLAIVARAGSGKTTTSLEIVNQEAKLRPNAEIVVCAYNKSIADEIKGKLVEAGHRGRNVQAATVHSLGFGLVRFAFDNPAIDKNKIESIVQSASLSTEPTVARICTEYAELVAKIVRVAKQAGVGFFPESDIADSRVWRDLMAHFDLDEIDDPEDAAAVVNAAMLVYKANLRDTARIDFDDMVLFPLIKNIRVRFQKDLILVDEAQDLSRTRQALVRKLLKPSGRLVIVGDDRQAIYGFSGADAEALHRLTAAVKAHTLPLSVSWRCGRSIIAKAQTIVPDIQPAPNAAEGRVIDIDALPGDLDAETAILCRNTAPLLTTAYGLLAAGIPCKVEGRDIGESLVALIRRWKVAQIDQLLHRVDTFQDRERQKFEAKGQDDKIEALNDRCEAVRAICNACIKDGKTLVSDVVEFVHKMFADNVEKVTTLCTYHRSKGREWNRVILVEHDKRCPSQYARQPWQKVQEDNLAYVAFTRAKETLAFLN